MSHPGDDGICLDAEKKVNLESVRNRRDKAHDRFIHYSNVRMTLLSLGLPIAAAIAAASIDDGFDKNLYSLAVVLAALTYSAFCFFSAQALHSLIEYSGLEKWLERELARDHVPVAEPTVRHHGVFRSYIRGIVRDSPVAFTVRGEAVLPRFRAMEAWIQGLVVVATTAFFVLVWSIAPSGT